MEVICDRPLDLKITWSNLNIVPVPVSLEKRQPSEIMKVLYSIFNPNFSMQVKKCIINDMRDICKILYLSNGSTEAFNADIFLSECEAYQNIIK